MKNCFLLAMFFASTCFSQEVHLTLLPSENNNYKIYALKIFNNLSKPIAVRCSPSFNKFSEHDTLELAMGSWYRSPNYYYGIDYSSDDSRVSENPFYHLLIIAPQTYLATNIKLAEFDKYKGAKFSLFYLTNLTIEDMKNFTNRDSIMLTKGNRNFLSKVIEFK